MDLFIENIILKINALKKISGFGIFVEKVTNHFKLSTGIRHNSTNLWMVNRM